MLQAHPRTWGKTSKPSVKSGGGGNRPKDPNNTPRTQKKGSTAQTSVARSQTTAPSGAKSDPEVPPHRTLKKKMITNIHDNDDNNNNNSTDNNNNSKNNEQ